MWAEFRKGKDDLTEAVREYCTSLCITRGTREHILITAALYLLAALVLPGT